MIKKLFLFTALNVALFANLNDNVRDILGVSEYNTHRNLINHLFKNQNSFYSNGQIDYVKITEVLSNNNLLKLNLGSTQDLFVTFNFNSNPKISLKNISDIIRILGNQNYITQEEVVVNNQLKWTVKIKTAAAISPLRLSQELQKVNSRILDIKREGTNKWSYSIDASNSKIYRTEDLVNNSQLSLKKPQRPYIVEVDNISNININSTAGNSWHPNIVFYDKNYNVLEIVEKDSLHRSLRLSVPNSTKYIKIDDFYSLANLKQGLNITKE